jgi:hypothetical protein
MELTATLVAPTSQDEIIVVKLWEIYLLYHPANLYKVLTEFSLDNGPKEDQQIPGRVVFRFPKEAWDDHVKNLLYEYRIPVMIQSNRLQAVKAKGRQPVFR